MGVITLVRHGQASFGAADYDRLSALGREQSVVAGRTLGARGLRSPLVCSGTLARQRDTASIVSDALGLGAAPSVDRRFDEYDHIGLVAAYAESHTPSTGSGTAASGVPSDTRTFQAVLDRALIEWIAADQPDGWRAFASGVVEAVTDLAAGLGSGRDAVVATSGGVIATICAHLLGGGGDAVVACNRVTVNAGFTTLLAGRSGLNLLTFNDHAHLLAEQDRLLTYR